MRMMRVMRKKRRRKEYQNISMTAIFNRKKLIPPKRVCLRLKEIRKKKGVSLKELAKRTKISKKNLLALEECRFNDLPSGSVYQKNFVKCYVEALGAEPGPYLHQYVIEETVNKEKKKKNQEVKGTGLSYLPFILRYGAVIAVALVLVLYLGMQVRNIIEPPNLAVYSPQDGYITTEHSLLVQGETGKEVQVSINGQEIMNNEQGQFEEMIDLSPGVNTIVVMAEKRHGKITTITRHVVLKQSQEISYLENSLKVIP